MRNLGTDSWVRRPQPNPEARLRLFCLPYAGGGASIFRTWPSALPADVELCPIQLPGREQRIGERAFDDLAALVEQLVDVLDPYLDRPCALFGHSMGALIAYEMVQKLRLQRGVTVAHLFVSGRGAPHCRAPQSDIHDLPTAAFVRAIRTRYDGIPDAVLHDRDLMALMLPLLRADFKLVESYRYQAARKLETPVTAIGGMADRNVHQVDLAAWEELTSGPFKHCMLSGGHFFLNEETRALLRIINDDLAAQGS